MAKGNKHIPVLTEKVVGNIDLINGGTYIDATLGSGGHTARLVEEIVAKGLKNITILAYDLDSRSIEFLEERLENIDWDDNVKIEFLNESFINIPDGLQVNAVYADLGLSQNQIEDGNLGFSYKVKSKLDMRYDDNLGVSAADLLNVLSKRELRKMFMDYGDIRYALQLAEALVDYRVKDKIDTTSELNMLIESTLLRMGINEARHPQEKSKIYQALRIAVNLELDNLQILIEKSYEVLRPDGKILLITFHSGEEKVIDKFVKSRNLQKNYSVRNPSTMEISENPRSRSAKLHIITR